MAPEAGSMVGRVTFLLVGLAATGVEMAAHPTRPVWEGVVWAGFWIGLAWALGRAVGGGSRSRGVNSRRIGLILAALFAAPFFLEPVRFWLGGEGFPLELQLLLGLRNLGLGLATCSYLPLCQRSACVVSLFLVLFSVTMSDHPFTRVLLAMYTAAGSLWLLLTYWRGLRDVFAEAVPSGVTLRQSRRSAFPWVGVTACLVLVAGMAALAGLGVSGRTLGILAELLPTSGGTGAQDDRARGGVNDGPEEMSGNNPDTTGNVNSDIFLDSPLPTLYDMANDMYGEPFKPKEQERAIALDVAPEKARDTGEKPADSQRPSRGFPSARKSPGKKREAKSREARALFEVEGATPIHVRLAVYDRFSAGKWLESPHRVNYPKIEMREQRWMHLARPETEEFFALKTSHKFKLTSPEGSSIPSPPNLGRFRVGRVNQADFFGWAQEGVLAFAHRNTPAGITIETESRTVDPHRLEGVSWESVTAGARPEYKEIGDSPSDALTKLLEGWIGEESNPWRRAGKVLKHMRENYTLDWDAGAPPDHPDLAGYFLLEAKKGPDYLFATAAALMLRRCGLATRVAQGLYVDPDNFDPETGHTPVTWNDLHFWVEVAGPDGEWIVVEPTPGYLVSPPVLPLVERLSRGIVWLMVVAWERRITLGLVLVLLLTAWIFRREMVDRLRLFLWCFFPSRDPRRQLLRAVSILEWRGKAAGLPRKSGQTGRSWLGELANHPSCSDLDRFAGMVSWAAHSPPGRGFQGGGEELARLTAKVLSMWKISTLRRVAKSRAGKSNDFAVH